MYLEQKNSAWVKDIVYKATNPRSTVVDVCAEAFSLVDACMYLLKTYLVYRNRGRANLRDWGGTDADAAIDTAGVVHGIGHWLRRTNMQFCGGVNQASGSDLAVKASGRVRGSVRASSHSDLHDTHLVASE